MSGSTASDGSLVTSSPCPRTAIRVAISQICSGDPSGCPGHGIAYRYASGKTRTASVPLDLGGFAQAAGVSYWVTQHYGDCLDDEGADAPCVIDRAQLRFR